MEQLEKLGKDALKLVLDIADFIGTIIGVLTGFLWTGVWIMLTVFAMRTVGLLVLSFGVFVFGAMLGKAIGKKDIGTTIGGIVGILVGAGLWFVTLNMSTFGGLITYTLVNVFLFAMIGSAIAQGIVNYYASKLVANLNARKGALTMELAMWVLQKLQPMFDGKTIVGQITADPDAVYDLDRALRSTLEAPSEPRP